MLRHLLTIVLLGILLIDAQAQALTPPAALSGWAYQKEMKATG